MIKSLRKRILRIIFLRLFNIFLSNTSHFGYIKNLLLRMAEIKIEKSARIQGPIFIGPAVICEIGYDTFIGPNFHIYGSGKCIIGKYVDIGPDVTILTGSHKIGTDKRRAGEGMHYTINIGDSTWIGGRSTLFGNIKINKSSVIGAGSVVNRDIESNTINVGIPCKKIKEIL